MNYFTRRLAGVIIENKDALELISEHDSADTLFYVDPPYAAATRDLAQDWRGHGDSLRAFWESP